MTTVIPYRSDVSIFRPLAEKWAASVQNEAREFGLTVDVDAHLRDLSGLTIDPQSIILVLLVDSNVAGYMGLRIFQNPLGPEWLAEEHYWFVDPERRGRNSLRLLEAAKEWAKASGCSHLKMNASRLASDLHDDVCRLYERKGMKAFETSYIERI